MTVVFAPAGSLLGGPESLSSCCPPQDPQLDLAQRLRHWADQLPAAGPAGLPSAQLLEAGARRLSERGRMLGDLQQAARLVQEEMHRQGLIWLVRPVETATAASPSPLPPAREPAQRPGGSAVAVVTVHRSKGLEFPLGPLPLPLGWCQGGALRHRPFCGRSRLADGVRIALNRDWARLDGLAAQSR